MGVNLGPALGGLTLPSHFPIPGASGGDVVWGTGTDTTAYGVNRVLHTLTGAETASAGLRAGRHDIVYAGNSGAYSGSFGAADFTMAVPQTNDQNFTKALGGIYGLGVAAVHAGAGIVTRMLVVGLEMWANGDTAANKVVDGIYLRIHPDDNIIQDNVQNLYGLSVARLTKGNDINIGCYIEGGATAGLYVVQDPSIFGGTVYIGDNANANVSLGLTINQAAFDNSIMTFKSSDVATGLSTITIAYNVETDDFATFSKVSSDLGGLWVQALAESTQPTPFILETWGGAPSTTDTSASLGAMVFIAGQHDGANADADMAADSNLATWGEIDSNNAILSRMLLKADDGQLHLGQTTITQLDNEDDVMLVRALQRLGGTTGLIETPLDNPFYDYDRLRALGLVGEKDADGFFLFPLQDRLHAHEGALWQLMLDLMDVVSVLPPGQRKRLSPRLQGRLAVLEGSA